ncbi:cytochrome c [Streptomyces tauricus]|uniref:FxSxx-COOH system tetratricopeptide repeat protein n=1 Tax=Streptomyces tauricus TaxID=68274 RepID=UPI00167A2939|nr:FxSxx-COOH system tetratricopeptide repeat protein [Streptomyces tauricus]GHA57237.1 cytochrome c [Streptomyces tauricus]
MTGFPRERASGPGDGEPISGPSSPSVYPESVEYTSRHGARPGHAPDAHYASRGDTETGERHPDAAQAASPHWQTVADAVFLAAHWMRHGRPLAGRKAPVTDDGVTEHRPDGLPPASDTVGRETGEDGEAPDGPSDGPAGPLSGEARDDPPPPGGALVGEALPYGQLSHGDPLTRPWQTGDRVPDPSAFSRLLPVPDPEGPERAHPGRPLLPVSGPGTAVQSPGGGTALLARAMHRLARRVPSRTTMELDEETTAERGVVDGMWMPFLRPARTSAFDLVLLVDDAPTMKIWEDATAGLAEAAEQSGAFRVVRTVKVDLPRSGGPLLRWSTGRTLASPAELLDGGGSRVFLVVTDGLGHGWISAAADALLCRLAGAGPTALVHLLPPHLRHRSSLYPYPAVLEAGGFGAANVSLADWASPGGSDPMRPLPEAGDGSVPVPVLSLKPGSIAAWADLVTGKRGVRRALPVVLAGALTKGAPAPGLRPPRLPRAATAAVRRFFTLATPAARRLATQLAAVPFEFDLVEQLRKRIMPETGPAHVAEILMGGLIDWDGGDGRPEFADGVREALLAATTRTQLALTVSMLGDLPAAGERGVALRAALRDPAGATLPDPTARGWLRTELAVMRALAGPYSERAKRIDADSAGFGPPGGPGPAAVPPVTPNHPESGGSAGGGEGSDPGLDVLDPPGEPVPLVTDMSRTEAPEAEPPMQSTTTGTSALLVSVPLRNTSFVGRTALLRAVEDQLGAQDTAAVLPHTLQGMGGVGKSQLALEYVYRHQLDYKVICWIPAERESLILAALAGLAARLRITPSGPEGGLPAANTAVPAVLEALRTGVPYDNWLLVFDNAENVEAVRSYFPANGPGKIIVTSRNRDWERVATPLPVNVFEREESIQLLQKRSPDLSERDADRLAEALGDLPLAVEQAGAWRAVTGMLVDDYLALLRERSPEILHLDPAPDYPVSVAAAWDISLERIKENNPGARELLDICACMAPEPVPLSMLRGKRGVDITPDVDPLLRESIKLSRAIRDLNQFSLVKLDLRSDTLQMHRLLQNVLLAKLSTEERDRMRDAAHQLLSAAKPGHYASSNEWPAYQALLPHVQASEAITSTDTWARELVYDTVLFLYYWGDHENAVELARQAWRTWLAASGEEDIHVIRIAKIFAFVLRVVGEVEESILLNERALEVSRRGNVDAEDLIDSMTQLAAARRHQGRFTEAEVLDREATERARTLFGPEDPSTLNAAHGWTVSLRLCGEYAQAVPLDQETARLRDRLFGPNSGLTLNTLNGLAIDMREAGDYPGARDFQEDVYRRVRELFGDENITTLRVARNLAVCRRRDGAVAEAAKLSEETLRRLVPGYGRDHYDTLSTAINVVVDRRLTNDLDRSRELGEATVRSYEHRLGENHAYTLITKANLAATMRALGALEAARELDDDTARRLRDTLGPRHVTTLTVALGQANTAYAGLDFDLAREIDEATLPLLAEIAGEEHPLTLSCTANLAVDLRGLGRRAEADELERKAVEGFTRVVRSDHPWLLSARQRRRIECDLAPVPM